MNRFCAWDIEEQEKRLRIYKCCFSSHNFPMHNNDQSLNTKSKEKNVNVQVLMTPDCLSWMDGKERPIFLHISVVGWVVILFFSDTNYESMWAAGGNFKTYVYPNVITMWKGRSAHSKRRGSSRSFTQQYETRLLDKKAGDLSAKPQLGRETWQTARQWSFGGKRANRAINALSRNYL